MGLRAYALPVGAGPTRLSDVYGGPAGIADPATDIPYRELLMRAAPGPVTIGDATLTRAGTPGGIVLAAPSSGGGSSYAAQVVADGATAYWRLNETSGTVASDSAGTRHATLAGGVTLGVPGPADGGAPAVANDGTGWGHPATFPGLGTTFTLEAWVFGLGPSSQQRSILSRVIYQDGDFYWALLRVDPAVLRFFYHSGGPFTFDVPFTYGVWHHLVVTAGAGTGVIYVDGGAVLTQPMTTGGPGAGPWALLNQADAVSTFGWFGSICDLAIYPTVLTPAQIANHYALRTATAAADPATPATQAVTLGANGLILGPFSSGPLKLSSLYATGAGSVVSIVGVPY